MKIRRFSYVAGIVLSLQFPVLCGLVLAQIAPPSLAKYIKVPGGAVLLNHVRVIDGTGADPLQDQAVLIEGGKIARIGTASATPPPSPNVAVIDLTGSSLLPGLVGMHNHLYYIAGPEMAAEGGFEPPLLLPQTTFTAPRMYLAAGVTTMRTTGSIEPYADLNLKHEIDLGRLPGPHIDVTGPYLEGPNGDFIQMHVLTGPTTPAQRSISGPVRASLASRPTSTLPVLSSKSPSMRLISAASRSQAISAPSPTLRRPNLESTISNTAST